MNLPTYVTAKFLADLYKVKTKTIYEHARTGELPAIKIGGVWRFDLAKVRESVEGIKTGEPFETDAG